MDSSVSVLVSVLALSCSATVQGQQHVTSYLIGTGKTDITGPAAEINMVGSK